MWSHPPTYCQLHQCKAESPAHGPPPDCRLLSCLHLQLNNLYDMQHMWYEVRSGDAYQAAGQLPKALKKYTSVAKHFSGGQRGCWARAGRGEGEGERRGRGRQGGLPQSAASAAAVLGVAWSQRVGVCRSGQASLPSRPVQPVCACVPACTHHRCCSALCNTTPTHFAVFNITPTRPAALLDPPPSQTSLRTSLTSTATVCAS